DAKLLILLTRRTSFHVFSFSSSIMNAYNYYTSCLQNLFFHELLHSFISDALVCNRKAVLKSVVAPMKSVAFRMIRYGSTYLK
ncbi:hypothetical protein Y032_0384g387, partial [Ancylostoma ceylanicum]